jgi:hypothetical protein
MNAQAVAVVQSTFSLVVYALVLVWFVVPRLRPRSIGEALVPLLLVHCVRPLGLSYLVPGITDPELPAEFTRPTAYGDLVAAVLALACVLVLRARPESRAGIVLAWVFNVVGLADLAVAQAQGFRYEVLAYRLEATWFIPMYVVPALIVTHAAMFWMLARHARGQWGSRAARSVR